MRTAYAKALQKYSERTALRYDGTTYSYEDLDRQSNRLANAFVDAGVESGDRVAVLMSNRPEFVVSELAIVKAGGVKILLNDMLGVDEVTHILSDSRVETILCGPQFVGMIDDLYDDIDTLDTVVCLDETPENERFDRYEQFTRRGDPAEPPDRETDPADVLFHAYTGGTTGDPKGVLHTHRSRAMVYYGVLVELDLSGDDTVLVTTPLSHSAGSFARSALLAGGTVVLRAEFEADRALRDIETHGITWTFMVPTMIYRLLDSSDLDARDVSSLETLVYGAAPMKTERLRQGLDEFGAIFMQFYGQTEVPNLITTLGKEEHAIALRDGRDSWLSSAGHPTLLSDVKIVDTETGETQPPGEPGEIFATAPYTMREYFELPEATAETLQDGWIATGDVGRRDETGYVTLLDRRNNLVITGGMNVYTTKVEDTLVAHEGVKDVAVIGVPDDDWGEAVKAIVVPYDGVDVSEADVRSLARENLSDYKVPKSVDFVSELPETPFGKVDKSGLRERYWDGEDRQIG